MFDFTVFIVLSAPATEITLARERQLTNQSPLESLKLEYKEMAGRTVVETVAAMANSYGGMIFVGVTDGSGPNRLVGVPRRALWTSSTPVMAALSHLGSRRSSPSLLRTRRRLY
jgi:hypothetical protein